jgi:hypothetical protein
VALSHCTLLLRHCAQSPVHAHTSASVSAGAVSVIALSYHVATISVQGCVTVWDSAVVGRLVDKGPCHASWKRTGSTHGQLRQIELPLTAVRRGQRSMPVTSVSGWVLPHLQKEEVGMENNMSTSSTSPVPPKGAFAWESDGVLHGVPQKGVFARANDGIRHAFAHGRSSICPSMKVSGRQPRQRTAFG